MKIETTNTQRVLTSDVDMWLCNKNAQVISEKVYLGINASESDWEEITETEKLQLEAQWNGESIHDPNEATTADLYSALGKLGVE